MSDGEESYLISERTGDRLRLDGCRRGPPNTSAPRFGSSRLASHSSRRFPPSVDLRRLMTPVEHQGNLNSCVGNALAGAIEFLIKRDSGKEIDISRLYLYYNARLIESDDEQSIDDVGVSIDGGVAALKKYGSCKEENHPYAESVVNDRPPAHCYEEGKRFRLDSSEAMDADLNQMKCCLADGFPFLFGLECFPSFSQSETNGGLVSMPKADRGEQAYGCHAMLAVGYLDDRQVFIVRNSYGDQWGDEGYIYVPFDYMTNDDICFSRFAVKSLAKGQRRHTDERIEYNPTVDYPSLWTTSDSYDHYDPTAFWHDESYLTDLQLDENAVDWDNSSSEIFFGSRAPGATTTVCRVSRDERRKEKLRVLWIHQRTNENDQLAKTMAKRFDLRLDFAEKFGDAEKYLQANKDAIRSSFRFVIISRGYFSEEKKNPMDLHELLLRLKLGRIPIVIYTSDLTGLKRHFDQQSKAMKFPRWKDRFEMTNDQDELVAKVKCFLNK